jgi:hypothetical protein
MGPRSSQFQQPECPKDRRILPRLISPFTHAAAYYCSAAYSLIRVQERLAAHTPCKQNYKNGVPKSATCKRGDCCVAPSVWEKTRPSSHFVPIRLAA